MPISSRGIPRGLIAVVLTIVPLLGSAGWAAAARPYEHSWQFSGSSYESPQFGYVVEWDDTWAPLERDASSDGGVDSMTLANNNGRVRFAGQNDESSAAEVLDDTIETLSAGADAVEIISDDREGAAPTVELTADRDHVLLEVQTVDGAVIVVSLIAREGDYADALALAQGGISLNGTPVLSGEAIAPTEEPTEEPTEIDPATPESNNATPVPSGESGLTGNTFVSASFEYTLEVPADWTIASASSTAGEDTLIVSNGVSTVELLATNAYNGDLPGCISFAEGLIQEDPEFADLRLETTADGEPFRGDDDVSAYALFSYTGVNGEKQAHFVHCQSIEEGESVLIIFQDVAFDAYASERQARREIQNAIDLP